MSAYSLNDTNIFTYCGNDPVSRADDGGDFWHIVAGASFVGYRVGKAIEQTAEGFSGIGANYVRRKYFSSW